MELTVEQALQQGVAAHKEGKFQDAERLYRAILQTQPAHPDANHNLGVLAVSLNKIELALPLFKTALEANPNIEQFWLSYIDALVKTEKEDDARRVVADALKAKVDTAKLQIYAEKLTMELPASSRADQEEGVNPRNICQGELSEAIELREVGRYQEASEWLYQFLQDRSDDPEALSLLSQVLLLDKREAEAQKALRAAASINPALPSVYLNQARLLLKQSKTVEALNKAQLGCKKSPDNPESLLVLASCLRANKRDLEALPLIEKTLKIKPNYAEAYANRAVIKLRARDTTGAIEDAKTAVSLKPHLAEMWFLLSSMHYQESKLSDAIEALRNAQENEPKNASYMIRLGEFLRQDDQANEAICVLKQATELAPENADAWTNLGVVFQQEGKISNAKTAYEKALALNPGSAATLSNLGAMAKHAEEWESALKYFEQALEIEPDFAEVHYNLGTALKELGRLDEAEARYNQAILLKPGYAEAYINLGNILRELNKPEDASNAYTQAIALKSNHAGVHLNLGATLTDLGKIEEALDSYKQAIALEPNYAEAHFQLGNTFKELEMLDEAELSYNQAISLKADFVEAYCNLGVIFSEQEKFDDALESYRHAIALQPNYAKALFNLGVTISSVEFSSSKPELYPALVELLTNKNLIRPKDLARNILSLLKHDPLMKDLLLEKHLDLHLDYVKGIIDQLHDLELLHHLMRVCPLPNLHLERFLIAIRSFLLKNLDEIDGSPEVLKFMSTLSLHCFTNEYVYPENKVEISLIEELEKEISRDARRNGTFRPTRILCLASFRPLYRYDWCQQLESLTTISEVKVRQVEEPLAEKTIAQTIPVLAEISNETSFSVKEQYEENPYPRWINLGISTEPKALATVFDELRLRLHCQKIKNVNSPSILIAGCGTGQDSIGVAARFSNCHVTAVDLSITSLAYAQRKATELGFSNLDYLQADILNLNQLDKKFDIIESLGVLHHMENPVIGWRILTNMLKPGGVMKVGLYSEFARRQITEIRDEILAKGLGKSKEEIKEFRQSLIESQNENYQQLKDSIDFYSLSTLTDLLFHVQEHQFNLPLISELLDELELKFCGFEARDMGFQFRKYYGENVDIHDLQMWHEFEKENPETFSGMYQFWCQKI